MSKNDPVMVKLLTDPRLRGATVPRPRHVAEFLVDTGQAEYVTVETRPIAVAETPEEPTPVPTKKRAKKSQG